MQEGRGQQAAIVYDSPASGTGRSISYSELLHEVQAFALVLRDLGVRKGDRVLLYMPMVPEALIGMLACARIGAVHSVVFGGFAATELARRIEDAEPKVILSTSCGLEGSKVVPYKSLLDGAIEVSEVKPAACVILARPKLEATLHAGRDVDWMTERAIAIAALRVGPNCCHWMDWGAQEPLRNQ